MPIAFFERYKETSLYTSPADKGCLLYFGVGDHPNDTLTLRESWNESLGYYLFLAECPNDLDTFNRQLTGYFPAPEHTSFAWLEYEGGEISSSVVLHINQNSEVSTNLELSFGNYGLPLKAGAPILTAKSDRQVDLHDEFDGFLIGYPALLGFPPAIPERFIQLPFSGNYRGCLKFQTLLSVGGIGDAPQFPLRQAENFLGFRYFVQAEKELVWQSYPLINTSNSDGSIKFLFNSCWDPVAPTDGNRTFMSYTGAQFLFSTTWGPDPHATLTPLGSGPNPLKTYFTTIYGVPIYLSPVQNSDNPGRFVLASMPDGQFYFTPAGDYELILDQDNSGINYLLCGLSGTEYLGFTARNGSNQGDILTFYPDQPAYAPVFPIITGSSTSAQASNGPLLSNTVSGSNVKCETAWISIRPGKTSVADAGVPKYFSQPQKSPLYKHPSGPSGTTGPKASPILSLFSTPSAYFRGPTGFTGATGTTGPAGTKGFPMVPYTGITGSNLLPFFSKTGPTANGPTDHRHTLRDFEMQIINPSRKHHITKTASSSINSHDIFDLSEGGQIVPSVTPQGLFVRVNSSNNRWKELILCKNLSYSLALYNLDAALQSALQTNEQFLVITQPDHLGTFSQSGATGPGAVFHNIMGIEGWPFIFDVGSNNQLGNYNNVLIFKFCSGSVLDRTKNKQSWTNASTFNSDNGNGISNLSSWLSNYIQDGIDRYHVNKDEDFKNFSKIVTDPNWNGILGLKLDISIQDFPSQLQGLLAGIDLTQFNAHHFGIDVNHPIQTGPVLSLSDRSSLFALINYQSPNPSGPSVAPKTGYDFNVLLLKVLFENSRITNFASKVSLRLDRFFDDPVIKTTTNGYIVPNNSIILNGNFEDHNGYPTYIFNEEGENKFYLNSTVLRYVEIVKANFSTALPHNSGPTGATGGYHTQSTVGATSPTGATGPGPTINSVFSTWGYLNFSALGATGSTGSYQGFDLLSFGSEEGQFETDTKTGLSFSNLNIDMQFPLSTPASKKFAFDTSHMAFDLGQSTTRKGSLYQHFPLQLTGLASGGSQSTMADQGFLPVNIPTLSGTAPAGPWYGLVFNLDLGSAGALASKAGFNARLLASWGPGSASQEMFSVAAGLSLPGMSAKSKSLSLEGVLKLDINQLELIVTPDTHAYLLKLNEIALKFLGMKIPPSAAIDFFLFGNPGADASSGSLGWYGAYQKSGSTGNTGSSN